MDCVQKHNVTQIKNRKVHELSSATVLTVLYDIDKNINQAYRRISCMYVDRHSRPAPSAMYAQVLNDMEVHGTTERNGVDSHSIPVSVMLDSPSF